MQFDIGGSVRCVAMPACGVGMLRSSVVRLTRLESVDMRARGSSSARAVRSGARDMEMRSSSVACDRMCGTFRAWSEEGFDASASLVLPNMHSLGQALVSSDTVQQSTAQGAMMPRATRVAVMCDF